MDDKRFRSNKLLCGLENASVRNLAKGMGYSDDDLTSGRPIIAIANSWNTIVPGHYNLNQISEQVKKGIHRAGGTVFEFGVIGLCDGMSQENFNYILPSRELICNSIESVIAGNPIDGVVLLASCDKILPAMLMAAARLDIPSIVINGGPMLGIYPFEGRKADATSTTEAVAMYKANRISEDELKNIENMSCPTCGSCQFMGTANTMGCLTEALGMSLPGCATVPAVFTERLRLAVNAGEEICNLVRKNIKARDIITKESIENAIKVCLAIGGSTNAILHLIALAYEAEVDLDVLKAFEEFSKTTPTVLKIYPSGDLDMEDFWKAGGIPRVLENLKSILNTNVLTCTGKSMMENIDSYKYTFTPNDGVIRKIDNPFGYTGGVAIMRGNLAPGTGISKPAAIHEDVRQFTGIAKVFNSEIEATSAIINQKITHGDIVVIRYEGPKGGPGMVEMYRALKYLHGLGLHKSTAVITDGRFSGTNNGCFVGHISPEAYEGGPLAIVEDGDKISIDVINNKIELHVSNEEIENRFKYWKRPEPRVKKGYLSLYSQLASSANEGAVIKHIR